MFAQPQQEHHWLERFIGTWSSEAECRMGGEQHPTKSRGTEVVRSLGGLWIIAEGQGEMPDGTLGTMLTTLGYDPQSGRYVGTFVGSMMTHLWLYNGTLNARETVLTLHTEGPDFTGQKMARYQDIVEFVSAEHRTLTSQILGDDGHWHPFMTAHYWRQK